MALSLRIKYIVCAIAFFIAGTTSLIWGEPLLFALPFLALLLPALYEIVVHKAEWIFYALIALLPLSTEINFTPSLGIDFPDEILMMLLTGLFLIKAIYSPSLLPRYFYTHPLILLLFFHFAWIVIATIFSTDPILSIKYLLAKTWFIVPFVILPYFFLNNKKRFRLIGLLLLLPMGFVVIQSLLRHAFFQFSFVSVKEIYGPFFRNHVNFSAMLVCLLAVLFAMYKLTSSTLHKKIIAIGILMGLTSVVLAYSRGAWVALIIGIAAYWLIRKKLIVWSILLAVTSLIIVTTWSTSNNKYLDFAPDYNTTIFHKDFDDHLQATIQFKDVSNAERLYRWIAGLNMIAEKPVTGFGPNNFYNNYRSYTETPFKTWVSNNPEHSSVHNYFILTALEQGVPGLVLFSLLYFAMIVYSQRLYHKLKDTFYKQVAITIGVILVMIGALIFMSDLIETDKIGSLFWLCLGTLIVLSNKQNAIAEMPNQDADRSAYQ
jgi:O-antigen ligase